MSKNDCVNYNDNLALHGELSAKIETKVLFGVIYTIIITLSCCANGLILITVAKNPKLRVVRNVFIAFLAASDLTVALTSGIATPVSMFLKNWVFGSILCRLIALITGMSMFISTYTMMAIAIDRYILIVKVSWKSIDARKALWICSCIWVVAFCGSVVPASKSKITTVSPFCGEFCIEDWGTVIVNNQTIISPLKFWYGALLPVFQLVVPLCFITYCYTMVCNKINQIAKFRSGLRTASYPPNKNQTTEMVKSERDQIQRTNRILIAMVVTFACCWSPQISLTLLRDFGQMPDFAVRQPYVTALVVHSVAMVSTVINPVLYGVLNRNFRDAFLAMVGWSVPDATNNKNAGNNNNQPTRIQSNRRKPIPSPNEEAKCLELKSAKIIVTQQQNGETSARPRTLLLTDSN